MLNNAYNVKTVFSIKDLENLSGIKAHTIRIWEKRYNVLQPMRSDTNIRNYDLQSLQKLLNVVLLNDYGYKISRIAEHSSEKIELLVREIISEKSTKNHAINAFKMANADLILIPVIIVSLFIGVVLLIDYLSGKDYDSE